jgi:hypothetical protein
MFGTRTLRAAPNPRRNGKMQVEITQQDIEQAERRCNSNDPLIRAVTRKTGKNGWWDEVFSQGRAMANGQVWRGLNTPEKEDYEIDSATTKALLDFDRDLPFEPRIALLRKL